MRNTVAEWILSIVAPEDRAKTILGDLLEAQLGSMAFWSSLLRAAISIGMHRPRRLLSNVVWLAVDIGSTGLWLWVFTHVIGLSLQLTLITLILVELVLRLTWRRRRREIPGFRRTS